MLLWIAPGRSKTDGELETQDLQGVIQATARQAATMRPMPTSTDILSWNDCDTDLELENGRVQRAYFESEVQKLCGVEQV